MRAGVVYAGVRVLVLCVCNVVLDAADVASLRKTTLKGDVCERSNLVNEGVPWLTIPIDQLTIFHFPADASLGRCNIIITRHHSLDFMLSTSHGTPCGFGMMTSPDEIFENIDLCSVNGEARVHESVVLALNDINTNPEFTVAITPRWMCDRGDNNVSCCDDKYAKHISENDVVDPDYSDTKNFTMLCDGQYCMEEAYICDGVASCADGKDEGEVCGVTDAGNVGRVSAAWVMAATSALLFTP